jgi:beta-mannosidase
MLHQLSLNGPWKMRWTDGQRGRMHYANRDAIDASRYFDATVPGEVHLELMRLGLIGDVYRDTNVLAARWVEENIWSYRREFDVTEDMLKAPHVWLHCAQLDLVATIVLNGQEIGRHANVFYPCRLDVTGKLRPGKNVLAIHLDSGLFDVADKPYKGYDDSHLDGKLHKRHWLRKPQCSFSWDWSQRLINVGVTGSVALEWSNDPVRLDQIVPLVALSDDLGTGTVRVRAFIENPTGASAQVDLAATLDLGAGKTVSASAKALEVKPGLHPYEVTLEGIESPELWWPVGHGSQRLYPLHVTLACNQQQLATKQTRIGFRHVRINQDKHPVTGRYFIIEINHQPIFCKGGNFVPADMIFMRADRARYNKLTDLALESNFNLLRIWGGGMYETDEFYELCDEKGILVWQEFIFACCKYPGNNEAFHDDIKREARYNIRRLATHASLIVWCGNNEMEQGAWEWGYDKGVVLPDYHIFHLTLPRLMAEEDPTRYYQPSSPFSPDHRSPTEHETGDQHPWAIGFFDTDFRKYRAMAPRFPNEGGCLGPTALPTMLACLPEGQRFAHSFAWEIHDNSISMWEDPSPADQMIHNHLGLDITKMSIEQFTYLTGLVQGEALKEYCESFRRQMFSCSSAIFWMYNDTWPCVRSWTTVDYYLRRTPAFWSVKRSMMPLTVIVAEDGANIAIYGVNETRSAVGGTLRYGLFNLAGGYPLNEQAQVTLPPNASTKLASFPRGQWPDPTKSLAFATLEHDGRLLARNRLILPLLKELQLPKADVKVELRGGQAVFTSPAFGWGVCLDLHGETALPDNLFDLYPGMPYALPWKEATPPQILHAGM